MRTLAGTVLALALSVAAGAADKRLEKLSPEHRKWLEEDVVHIILERERDIFLSLETQEERERFIEAFWRKRDPNPATPQNEFKDEHYARIEYANKFLGRETFRQGWKTDRGRMYILLGKPREVQNFDGYNQLTAAELWFYEGDSSRGLPSFFYLLFFKRHGVGEYQLYHPVADGPSALLRGQYSYTGDVGQALQVLREISPELAQASLSFDTSDPPDYLSGRASLGTDIMLARIYDSPKRAVRTDYAEAWARYGKKVSAEYSFNFVESRSVFAVLAGPENTPFVHYSIEIDPQNFSMETDEDRTKFYTTLDVSLEVRDAEDRLILANDKEVYLELTPSQVDQVKASPFAYQDDFPLIPGEYKVSVILRNRVLTQYTVAEQDLKVEGFPPGQPALSEIVLGYGSEMALGASPTELRTFQVGDRHIYPSAGAVFPIGEPLHVFFQVLGASPEHGLHFALLDGSQKIQERSTKVGDYAGGPVLEQFPLTSMVGGEYVLKVALTDPSGKVLAEKSAPVVVSPRSVVPRPWAYRRSFNAAEPGLVALARGEQLLNQRRFAEARAELEKAVAANNPKLVVARWRLAGALIESGEADRVLDLLAPLEESFPKQYEVVAGLGFAHYLKNDFPKAVGYFERALTIRPPDTSTLNALGDCYQRMGNSERAREIFRRSLDLNPEQQAVKDRLSAIDKSQ